jgi:hypothetical protein
MADEPILLCVAPNDDPNLSCLLCHGREHIPRTLMTTYYTPTGRVAIGIHQDCYDRARVPIRGSLTAVGAWIGEEVKGATWCAPEKETAG